MKILVDRLPESWQQCPEHTVGYHDMRPVGENMINACKKHPSRNFECRIGEPGFECPFYLEFHARTYIDERGHNQETVLWNESNNTEYIPPRSGVK